MSLQFLSTCFSFFFLWCAFSTLNLESTENFHMKLNWALSSRFNRRCTTAPPGGRRWILQQVMKLHQSVRSQTLLFPLRNKHADIVETYKVLLPNSTKCTNFHEEFPHWQNQSFNLIGQKLNAREHSQRTNEWEAAVKLINSSSRQKLWTKIQSGAKSNESWQTQAASSESIKNPDRKTDPRAETALRRRSDLCGDATTGRRHIRKHTAEPRRHFCFYHCLKNHRRAN